MNHVVALQNFEIPIKTHLFRNNYRLFSLLSEQSSTYLHKGSHFSCYKSDKKMRAFWNKTSTMSIDLTKICEPHLLDIDIIPGLKTCWVLSKSYEHDEKLRTALGDKLTDKVVYKKWLFSCSISIARPEPFFLPIFICLIF